MLVLKDILHKRNISVRMLSRMMDERGLKLSSNSINKILGEESSPKLSTLQDIADTLDIHLTELFASKKKNVSVEEMLEEIKTNVDSVLSKINE